MNEKSHSPLRPVKYRRSSQLGTSWVLWLSIGLWLIGGVLGLYDPAQELAGKNAFWAYVVAGLLLIPSLLSQVEMRSWLGSTRGSYRLIQACERPHLTFLAGWTMILGWLAVGGLVARIFAHYAYILLGYLVANPPGELILAALMIGVFIIANIVGYRPNWRLSTWIIGSVVIIMALLALVLFGYGLDSPGQLAVTALNPIDGGRAFFAAAALLIAGGWGSEIVTEPRRRGGSVAQTLVGNLAGPLVGAALAAAAFWAADRTASLAALAAAVTPLGEPLLAGMAVLVSAVGWQMLALLMLRQFHSIGRDGIFHEKLLGRQTRFKTPVFLILIQGGLALAALFIGDLVTLAWLATLAFLVLQFGVNLAAIILARHPKAENRSFVLPLYPVIPASGAAISFLLLFALPGWPVLVIGAAWYAVGMLFYWQVVRDRARAAQRGVTVFQDLERRPDITSDYPVLIPVANPDTAMGLVAFGAAIARQRGGHLVLVQVINVPEQLPLDSARYQARQKLSLLDRVLDEAESLDVPVEGITRLARSIPQGILETIVEESVKVCVMGWNARPDSPGRRGLGHILDEVLDNAVCDVAVVRGDWSGDLRRVLVPTSTGPHAPLAAEMALALTEHDGDEVTLLNVTRIDDGKEGLARGQEILDGVKEKLRIPSRVNTRVLTAQNPKVGILEAVADQDALLLGISELAFLDQPVRLQLPIQIAQETDKPFALIRNYSGLTTLVARKAWQSLAEVLPTLEAGEQMQVYRDMERAARPQVNYFVLIALSAMIATLGLLLNSPAVIIGAMLVAPLMSPIVATASGIVFGDIDVLRNGLTSTIQGVVAAIFIAILATLITPLRDATPEVLARTSPNLLDLLVALVSGMAGAYAIARKEVGEALPGVAIAAALMPPVCTVGIGIALGSVAIAFGALVLFVANLVAIIFASAFIFLLLGMHPPQSPDRQRRLRQGLLISIVSLLVISLPLGVALFQTSSRSKIESQAREIVRSEVESWQRQGDAVELVELDIQYESGEVTVKGTMYAANDPQHVDIPALSTHLNDAMKPAVHVQIFQIDGQLLDENAPLQQDSSGGQ